MIWARRYVAKKDTKNFTLYVPAETPESTFNGIYLPKGLPQTVEVQVHAVATTEQSK